MMNPEQHGAIEAADGTADQRLEEQRPWLARLPADFRTVLDVGAGVGVHSKYFLDTGRLPTALDRYSGFFRYKDDIAIIPEDLADFSGQTFDAVFCSHVVEHFPDALTSLRHIRSLIRDDGYVFVIVPPYVPVSVNYHWQIGWHCSQLAMLLVAAGFDCSGAVFMELPGHVCGWGRKRPIPETKFNLTASLPYLPKGMADALYERDGALFLPEVVHAEPAFARRRSPVSALPIAGFSPLRPAGLDYGGEASWRSLEMTLPFDVDIEHDPISVAILSSTRSATIRIAMDSSAGMDFSDAAECYFEPTQGVFLREVRLHDCRALRGRVDGQRIRRISIGGFGQDGTVRIFASWRGQDLTRFAA